MGSDSHFQIPVIDFSSNSTKLVRYNEEWLKLCKRVREACENYGCFEIISDIPVDLKAKAFSLMLDLFNLPVETKKKNVSPRNFAGYTAPSAYLPFYETFGIEDSGNYESSKSFTELMWPNGHDHCCNTIVTITKKLEELRDMIEMMIVDSYGFKEKSNSIIPCKTVLRMTKYTAPPSGDYSEGLPSHTDKTASTILCEDQVSGFEYENKDGQWVKLSLSPTSYLFLVGDPLMAWSNGRMHSVKHRVIVGGEKDRYSLGAFANPKEGTIIKAAEELVDEEHPRILKDFDFDDFGRFIYKTEGIESENQIFEFAGINTCRGGG